jgi:hypothetical protein
MKACKECPFRKNAPKGWLGDGEPEEGLSRYQYYFDTDTAVHCHMNQATLCRGFAHTYNNQMKLSRNRVVAAFQGEVKKYKEAAKLCFDNIYDFIKHHKITRNAGRD